MSEANRTKAEADYLHGMKYKDIAQKYGVTLNTIKSWKTRYKWDRKSVHTKEKSVHTKSGAPKGNQNAIGNRGGSGGPEKNSKAAKHGFFRKYLPDDKETKEIYDSVGQMNPLDLLWENIQIKFTAIIRAQKIMFVRDREDVTKVLTKITDGDMSSTNEWEYQHAWDKQANFLNAQARSMSTLASMIRQYEEMCRLGWADEEQQLRIDKLKAEVKALEGPGSGEGVQIIDDIGSGSDGTSQII